MRPFTHEEIRALARPVLEMPGADGIEVVLIGSVVGLTRYANSQIIQNTVQETVRAYVRAVDGRRFAAASTSRLDGDSLRATAERALEAARRSPEDPEFPGLPDPDEVGRAGGVMRFDEATAGAGPTHRADAVASILKIAGDHEAAGIFETSAHAYAVVSSTGVDCYDTYTRCVASCLCDTGTATGYKEMSSHAVDGVDEQLVAHIATRKAVQATGGNDLEPGAYEVVLEPAATSMLLEYLSYIGFGAKQVIDGESFLTSHAGTSVADSKVTIADDVFHPLSVGLGFDFEGVPRRRVAVIDSGTATGPVTDLRTARRLGRVPTGHYSGSNEFGPYASNVVMTGGDSSLEELVGGVSQGLLVTRFHYVNVLDRPRALLTGMTRDGTWRIRNGEIAESVHNLRFTQSVLDALHSVRGIGRDLEAFAPEFGSFGSTVAPAIRCGEFEFTSTTSH